MAEDLTRSCRLVVWVELDTDGSLTALPVSKFDKKLQVEPIVDATLDRFQQYFSETLKNDRLSRFERAAIKTFLHWMLFTDKRDATAATPG
jgi:hypothetical protein